MTTYFRPDLGLCARTANGWQPVLYGDNGNPQPGYDQVTHLRVVRLDDTAVTGDGRTLEGIASPFGQETVIDSWWEGTFREKILPGAFTQTITEDRQIMQFDHGMSTITGSLPLGPIQELKEVPEGLYVRGRLRDTPLINEIREAIADGSITGQSIQFRVRKDIWTEPDDDTDELPLREIANVRLYELGPVVWPAYETTTVGVRGGKLEPGSETLLPEGTGNIRQEPTNNLSDIRRIARLARLRVMLSDLTR